VQISFYLSHTHLKFSTTKTKKAFFLIFFFTLLIVDKLQLMIFDSDGNFKSESGTRGEENGNFNFPRDMALDVQDRVYVLDSINNNVLSPPLSSFWF
jgi:hypothetical protein